MALKKREAGRRKKRVFTAWVAWTFLQTALIFRKAVHIYKNAVTVYCIV